MTLSIMSGSQDQTNIKKIGLLEKGKMSNPGEFFEAHVKVENGLRLQQRTFHSSDLVRNEVTVQCALH